MAEEEAEAMVVEEAEAERLRAALYKAEDLADLATLPSSILQKASSRLASLAAAAQPTAPARLARHASKANAKIKWRKDTPAKYTDWTIKLMGHEYTVHRIILDYWDYWNRVFSQPGASGETDLRLSLGANSGQADFTVQRTTPAAFEWLLDFWYDPDGCTDVSAVGGEELIVLWALAGEFQALEQVRQLPPLSLFLLSPLSPYLLRPALTHPYLTLLLCPLMEQVRPLLLPAFDKLLTISQRDVIDGAVELGLRMLRVALELNHAPSIDAVCLKLNVSLDCVSA